MNKEYIEKEALKAQFAADGWLKEKLRASAYCKATKLGYVRERTIEQVIDCIPPADVKPVVRGEWIDGGWEGDKAFQIDGRGNCWHVSKCSVCGFKKKGAKSDFCPNCGADMRKEANDER